MAGRGKQGASIGWGVEDLTFFESLMSSSLPTGKSFRSKEKNFPIPGSILQSNIPRLDQRKLNDATILGIKLFNLIS